MGSETSGRDPTFETLEYEAAPGRPGLAGETAAFLVGTLALAVVAGYQWRVVPPGEPLVGTMTPEPIDWLYVGSLWAIATLVAVPAARNRSLTAYYWERLRRNRIAVASLAYLAVFAAVAVLGPSVVGPTTEPLIGETTPREPAPFQPPVGFGVPKGAVACAGSVVDGTCMGTWQYPLGTTQRGEDVLSLVVHGFAVAFKVIVIAGALMVPIGVAAGSVAGYVGGRIDEAIMRYVDLQQVLPGFFIVLILLFLYDGSLLLLVLVFGLLNWGGLARLVRSETLKKRESGFVKAARSAGASPWRILRRHVVPNTSSTVVTAITLQLPMLVALEATFAYLFSTSELGMARASVWREDLSWGYTIALGVGGEGFPTLLWWAAVIPAVPLLATTLALSLLGDGLRDALDPRVEP